MLTLRFHDVVKGKLLDGSRRRFESVPGGEKVFALDRSVESRKFSPRNSEVGETNHNHYCKKEGQF